MPTKYYSKVLLFGEYTILNNSSALAIPNHHFHGYWVDKGGPERNRKALNEMFLFMEDQNLNFLNLEAFKADLNNGLNFIANIPIGYGAGSSGAVSAAVYDKYKIESETLPFSSLRENLQKIENHFHGNSSGMDPLVSYLNKSILLKNNGGIELIEDSIEFDKLNAFLLDTGITRSTAPLVQVYKEKMQDEHFKINVENQLLELVELCIGSYLNKNEREFFKHLHELSNFQFRYFQEMILEEHKSIWLKALGTDHFKLKLCGAGGGGFILGYSISRDKTKAALKEYDDKIIWLDQV